MNREILVGISHELSTKVTFRVSLSDNIKNGIHLGWVAYAKRVVDPVDASIFWIVIWSVFYLLVTSQIHNGLDVKIFERLLVFIAKILKFCRAEDFSPLHKTSINGFKTT